MAWFWYDQVGGANAEYVKKTTHTVPHGETGIIFSVCDPGSLRLETVSLFGLGCT